MSFKGKINLEGRKPGTPNKVTHVVRETFGILLETNLEQLQKDLDVLKPYERIRVILELAKFVVPTLKAIEVDNTSSDANIELNQPIILQINERI